MLLRWVCVERLLRLGRTRYLGFGKLGSLQDLANLLMKCRMNRILVVGRRGLNVILRN